MSQVCAGREGGWIEKGNRKLKGVAQRSKLNVAVVMMNTDTKTCFRYVDIKNDQKL